MEVTWSLLIVGAVASIHGGPADIAIVPRTPTGANPGLLTAGLLLVLAVFALNSQSGRLDALAVTFGIAVTLIVVVRLQVALRERGMLANAMRHLATTDPLTGVPNRRAFDERVGEAVSKARKSGLSVGVLSINADGFKLVNDGFGHPVGDEVLRQIAHRLVEWRAAVRHGCPCRRRGVRAAGGRYRHGRPEGVGAALPPRARGTADASSARP